jgi:hypothetical protein
MIVPSPESGWYTKLTPSVVVASVPPPAPFAVNVPFPKLALPAIPTEPISPSVQPEGRLVTVKERLFAALPFTVAVNCPVEAPEGTLATIAVSVQLVTAAVVPLSLSVLVP